MTSDYRKNLYPQISFQSSANLGEFGFECGGISLEAHVLDWDTAVLGVKSARISELIFPKDCKAASLCKVVSESLRKMKDSGIRFLDIRVDTNCKALVSSLQELGFNAFDKLNIYVSQGIAEPEQENLSSEINFQFVDKLEFDELGSVIQIGSEAFKESRIYKDKNIKAEVADKFYEQLIRDTASKEQSLVCLAKDRGGKLLGFFISQKDSNLCFLWTIAVNAECRGKGIGKELARKFLVDGHQTHSLVEIGTQVENVGANKIYQALGLETKAQVLTFHLWL